MIESVTSFFAIENLTAPVPPPFEGRDLTLAIIACATVVLAGIALLIITSVQKTLPPLLVTFRKRVVTLLMTGSALALINILFRQTGGSYLSSRMALVLTLLACAGWAVYLGINRGTTVKRELAEYDRQKKIQEYLPKKKK